MKTVADAYLHMRLITTQFMIDANREDWDQDTLLQKMEDIMSTMGEEEGNYFMTELNKLIETLIELKEQVAKVMMLYPSMFLNKN